MWSEIKDPDAFKASRRPRGCAGCGHDGCQRGTCLGTGTFPVKTLCEDKTYSSRDRISEEISLRQRRQSPNTVSMISMSDHRGDGLSSSSIEANAPKILPIVMEGLKEKGISTGTPIFVKFGRVAAQDQISELLNAKIVCSFIGERPGLATAEHERLHFLYGDSRNAGGEEPLFPISTKMESGGRGGSLQR